MDGRPQGKNEQLIEASAGRIWSILEDSSVLPDWVPVVESVSEHESREGPGSVRRCNVDMGGKRGYIVERCVEALPAQRLTHAVDDDSLGFTKMFADYSFSLSLTPRAETHTLVTCESFYNPRGPVSHLMNALMMRRKFAGVRRTILLGLKELAESPRDRGAATRAAASP